MDDMPDPEWARRFKAYQAEERRRERRTIWLLLAAVVVLVFAGLVLNA